MNFLYVCLFMPAPVAKPQIGKQAVAARLRAGTHFSSSRVQACESSLAGLPGSGRAFSDVSIQMRARLVELERYERMAA